MNKFESFFQKAGVLEACIQALIILLASFIFPATSSYMTSAENMKQDLFKTKENILRQYATEVDKYTSYYCAYVKVCSFLASDQKEYLGLSRDNAGALRFKIFEDILDTPSPDILLSIVNSYYINPKIHMLSRAISDKIHTLTNLDLASPESEIKCDDLTKEISSLHTAIVSLMAIELHNYTAK